jgi:haloalkane dehalogenase
MLRLGKPPERLDADLEALASSCVRPDAGNASINQEGRLRTGSAEEDPLFLLGDQPVARVARDNVDVVVRKEPHAARPDIGELIPGRHKAGLPLDVDLLETKTIPDVVGQPPRQPVLELGATRRPVGRQKAPARFTLRVARVAFVPTGKPPVAPYERDIASARRAVTEPVACRSEEVAPRVGRKVGAGGPSDRVSNLCARARLPVVEHREHPLAQTLCLGERQSLPVEPARFAPARADQRERLPERKISGCVQMERRAQRRCLHELARPPERIADIVPRHALDPRRESELRAAAQLGVDAAGVLYDLEQPLPSRALVERAPLEPPRDHLIPREGPHDREDTCIDVFRTPDERFASLPDYAFAPHWLELDGMRMHYVDEGEGEPVLLLHGEPTWSYLWRKIISPLAQRSRVVAPDLLGFGRSDKPTDVDWYSYDRHLESLEQLVDALGLERLTLVVHDWGGPIGLRFAVEHEAIVDRIVILDTGIVGGRPPSERWLRFRDVVRQVGGELDIGRLVEAGTAQGLSDDVRAAYDAPFPTPQSKAGALAFPELVPTEPAHPSTDSMNRVRDALARWQKPVRVVWGNEDTVLLPRVAELFVELIPGAQSPPMLIDGASHFLQEDRPDEVTAAILGFAP